MTPRFPRLIVFACAVALLAGVLFVFQKPATKPQPAPVVVPAPATVAPAPEIAAIAPEPAPPAAEQPMPAPVAAFREWAAQFVKAAPYVQAARIADGVALARAHRMALKETIIRDPRRALEEAVPVLVRQQLPAEIVSQLEERVSARAFFGVLAVNPGSDAPAIRREVQTEEKKFDAYVYGRRVAQRTTEDALISGVAVDRVLAVDERPLRVLEAGEIPDAAKALVETCPISKKVTAVSRRADGSVPPVTNDTPAVEVAGTVHYLCSGGHILAFEEELIAQEGTTGGPSKPGGPIPTTYTTGVKKHLYIRVAFPDVLTDPQSERDCYEMMRQVSDFMVENSFGQCYFITTVTPLVVLPHSEAWYKQEDNSGAVLTDARALAKALGYDPAQYDFDTVRYSGGPGSFGGQAYVGGKGCWLKSSSVGVACHEYGHNLGLWHANYWNTSPASVIGPGTNSEYGNSFDTMGAASAGNNHFTAYHKHVLNWLKDDLRTAVVTSGTYRIFTYDQPVLDPSRRYALRIAKDVDRDYWIEFRTKFTTNQWFNNGLHFNWSSWGSGDTATGSNGGGQLLDMTPGSPDGKNDCALTIGRTFSDVAAGIHVTPIGKGGTVPESFDVVVNFGDFPTNQAPSLALSASATSVAANASITLTATASDPDGDALAYAWDFGDKSIGPNTSTALKSWTAAGKYIVRCTASDMKGKVATRFLIVTVGSPAVFTISGKVTGAAAAPVEGVLVSNGLTGSSFRGTYTDSNGDYSITNLAAGSHTISAALSGYTFTAGFTNPVAVGPDATAKNFTGTLTPTVTITAFDAAATEVAGNTGTFRLTRTGSTASALTVKLFNASGSATKGTDYALAPDLTSNTGVFDETIPAGSATLDIVLTPVQDTTSEGVETATLQVLPATGYLVEGLQQATIDITDDESTLPVVNLVASDIAMSESGETATLLVTRTGSTAAALVVSYTFSGAAALGTDFNALTSVTIPAGASSAPIVLTPIDDAFVEGNEVTTLTLTNLATYKRGVQQAQAIVVNDNDVNVVTATSSDSAASEGGDTGTFLITRTGDLTAALTVDFTLSGSAHHGTDYLPISGVASIPAGEASTTVTMVPIDDVIGEGTQTVVLQLRSQTTYLVGTPNNATINITDNDLPTVWVVPSDGVASEPSDTGTFRFRRNGNNAAFTLNYTVSGTAVPGTDYTALSGTVAFAAADTSKDVTLTPINNAIAEDAKMVTVTITPSAAYSITQEDAATVHLLDDDQVMVSVSTENIAAFGENGASARFWVSRNGSTTNALDVSYSMSGTATNGTDYALLSGTATIPAAAGGVYVTVTGVNDALKEGTETVTMNVVAGAGYGVFLPSATYLINDDDGALTNTVRFATATSSAAESAGTVNIPVTLASVAAAEITVKYAINGGSATGEGVDYAITNGTLTFDIGENAKDIPVTITDDIFIESSETVAITLSAANGASLGTSTHTITITDNDTAPAPTVGFAGATSSSAEAVAAPQTMVVSLSAAAATAVTVDYAVTGGTATDGTDYTLAAGTLTFTAGQIVKHIPIAVIDDGAVEANKTVIVTLSNATVAALSANTAHTFNITDDDAAVISVTATDNAASEPGSNTGTFTFTRTGSLDADLTVNFTVAGTATSGGDFTALGTTVLIPATQASATVTVTPLNDSAYDPNETVIVAVAANASYTVGSPSSATVTIADDDIGVNITATDANASEPADAGQFTVTRAGGTAGDLVVNLTVSGSATAGVDYTALPTTITIPNGQTSAPLTVNVIDDGAAEPVQTVIVSVIAGTGYAPFAPTSATVNISDDDANTAPTITLTSPVSGNVNIPAGTGLILEATVIDDGRPAPPAATTKTWTRVSGPGTVTFGSANAANTTATFSASGAYVLRLTANDGEFSVQRNVSVFVGGAAALWTSTNVNGVTPVGSGAEMVDGKFTVSGAGGTITSSSTSDGFFFYHQSFSGDFDVAAYVESISAGASASARSGLMCRADTITGSHHAFMAVTNDRTSFVYRLTSGGSSASSNTMQTAPVPRWVRLRRVGTSFLGYHSLDGITWTQQGSTQAITMTNPVQVGFAVTSASSGTLHTAVFRDVQIVAPATAAPPASSNLAAAPNAGGDASVQFPSPATLDGAATDDGRPIPPGALAFSWSKVSGPGAVTFGDEDAAQTSATFSAAGAYVLQLTADDGQVKTFDRMTVTSTLPVVTLAATDANAAELGLDAAHFTVTRTGGTGNNLTVNFTVTGTAANGSDYAALTGSITLPNGSATADIDIEPLSDALAEGAESVTVTLTAGTNYALGAQIQANGTIADLPIDAWRFAKFGPDANDPAKAGDLANFDGDEFCTLLEYILGTDPLLPSANTITVARNGAECTLTYPRALAATDVTVTVEWSEDLVTWRTDGITDIELSNNGTIATRQATVTSPGTHCAMRLRVTR